MNIIERLDFSGSYGERVKKTPVLLRKGVNLVIGPNGSGKSSVVKAITRYKKGNEEVKIKTSGKLTYFAFDFEMDNPRKTSYLTNSFQITSRFASHGEVNKTIIGSITNKEMEGKVVIMDEPEQALDFENLLFLVSCLKKTKATQVILATHSPVLMLEQDFHAVELVEDYRNKVIEHISVLLRT